MLEWDCNSSELLALPQQGVASVSPGKATLNLYLTRRDPA